MAALAIKAGSRDGETAPTFSGDDIFMRNYLRSGLGTTEPGTELPDEAHCDNTVDFP